jgi:hypothetical protein
MAKIGPAFHASNRSPPPAFDTLPGSIGMAMALRGLAQEHFGRGSVLGFVVILLLVVMVLLGIFWQVA